MSRKEVLRAGLLTVALVGKISIAQGALAMRVSVRQFQRTKVRSLVTAGAPRSRRCAASTGRSEELRGSPQEVRALPERELPTGGDGGAGSLAPGRTDSAAGSMAYRRTRCCIQRTKRRSRKARQARLRTPNFDSPKRRARWVTGTSTTR